MLSLTFDPSGMQDPTGMTSLCLLKVGLHTRLLRMPELRNRAKAGSMVLVKDVMVSHQSVLPTSCHCGSRARPGKPLIL